MATVDVDPVKNGQPETKEVKAKSTPETKNVSKGVDIKKLLESGAHFGHKTSRWHPKMAPYIHSKREGNHIIDLTKTVEALDKALEFLTKTTASGKQVLLVSTKRQAKDKVKEVAEATNMPFVVERWLGGMLTNQATIGGRIKHLKDLESRMISGELVARYSKLEVQRFQEEIDAMNHLYGGIKELAAKLGAVFVVDVLNDINAVREARKLGVPVVALTDTNVDPTLVDYAIPCNDDATKTISLILDYVQAAIEAGKNQAKSSVKTEDKATGDSEQVTEKNEKTVTSNPQPTASKEAK
jgi:small subunit ribosomal protein S2